MARRQAWSVQVGGMKVGTVPFMLVCCVVFTFTGVTVFWPGTFEKNGVPGILSGSGGSDSVHTIRDNELLSIINQVRRRSKKSFPFLSPLKILSGQPKKEEAEPLANNASSKANSLEDSQWTRANPPSEKDKLLLYSAFWDNRNNFGCVRLIATTLTKKSPDIQCRLLFDGAESTVVIKATKKPLNEHWNLLYASFLLSCCIENGVKVVPDRVTVFVKESESFGTTLKVRNNLADRTSPRGQLAVCVKPFHYNFNRATWLVEFLEFNGMMGVEHFLFYNNSVGGDVQRVLTRYRERGMVSVLPWTLDVVTKKEIRTEGMFGALNDCLYRLMYLFKYVLVIDIDEYVVPKIHENFPQLIGSVEKRVAENFAKKMSNKNKVPCTSGLSFKNEFFYLYWDNDTNLLGHPPEIPPRFLPYMLTQYKTRRLDTANKHGQRSKYFVAPEKALEIGNHAIWRKLPGCNTELISENEAALHHYRICEFGGFECLKKKSVIDRTAHKFGIDLLTRVLRMCYDIFATDGGTCPVTEPLGSPW